MIVTVKATLNEEQLAKASRFYEDATINAYRESGLFSQVHLGFGATDFKADVNVFHRTQANILLLHLTDWTFGLTPSYYTDELIVTTSIKDREDKILVVLEKSEAITTWQQLLLVFMMPLMLPSTVLNETLYDINRATIEEARKKGL